MLAYGCVHAVQKCTAGLTKYMQCIYQYQITGDQWCIAKNGGGYTQRGVAEGLKVPCLFMITEVSIRCRKNREVGIRRIPAYTPQYTTAGDCRMHLVNLFRIPTANTLATRQS